ncbi:hypothetical protein NKJ40_26025 [Mesorhizobium sp. M0119]|uniref:hypothetical protein n=1 Tax=Mesorhizobium sp. M0119 TaxID=2956885 RepID=UPI00333D28AC
MTLTRAAVNEYWGCVWMKVPFCVTLWGRRPADRALTQMLSSAAKSNESDWRSPQFDALLAQARVELDESKRQQIYFECQQMVADESGMSCFVIATTLTAIPPTYGE